MEKWVKRTALVTGASCGIGAALCRRLVKSGMTVVGCARNVEKIQQLQEELKGEAGSLLPVKCDLNNESEILSLFDTINSQCGGVDVCINNAGLAHNEPLISGNTEKWREMLNVNVLGLSICTREAMKSMNKRGVTDGHIIHINSMSGHRIVNSPATHFYSATKFAVTALVAGLRNELRRMKSDIRVTSISPGLVATEFATRLHPDNPDINKRDIKILDSDDVVDAVLFALQAPKHSEIYEIMMRPTHQEF
ncbi:dehydrogenase/reductase SDR family member 11-like isoform X1 [Argonauta hians]